MFSPMRDFHVIPFIEFTITYTPGPVDIQSLLPITKGK